MILYLGIIAFAMGMIVLFNALFGSACYCERGLIGLMLVVVLAVIIVFTIDMLISALVTVLPTRCFGCFEKVHKWEKRFYEKLGIKKWKDYVPVGRGPLFMGMDKAKIHSPSDLGYLLKLRKECFRAEVMHFFSIFIGFVIIVLLPLNYALTISLPVAVVNAILQTLPFFVQRYNLPKLDVLIKRTERNIERENKKQELDA